MVAGQGKFVKKRQGTGYRGWLARIFHGIFIF
jgi:hypothetical protein